MSAIASIALNVTDPKALSVLRAGYRRSFRVKYGSTLLLIALISTLELFLIGVSQYEMPHGVVFSYGRCQHQKARPSVISGIIEKEGVGVARLSSPIFSHWLGCWVIGINRLQYLVHDTSSDVTDDEVRDEDTDYKTDQTCEDHISRIAPFAECLRC